MSNFEPNSTVIGSIEITFIIIDWIKKNCVPKQEFSDIVKIIKKFYGIVLC